MLKKFLLMLTLSLLTMTGLTEAADGFEYVSEEYHYSIVCPSEPKVLPLRVMYDDPSKQGEMLVFESEGFDVKSGWVIMFDAFDTTMVPNFNNDSKKFIEQYIDAKKANEGYDVFQLIEVTKGNKGVLGVTAKEIEIDEDGDGTIDGVAIADHQEAIVFFRTTLGRCTSITLLGGDVSEPAINNFRAALETFKEVTANDKKDKKDKSDKKSKKDKKK